MTIMPRKIECCKSMADTNRLCSEMLDDYVSRVQEMKNNPSVSNLMRNACEYIKNHLTEEISIADLANNTGYTEYYFSHKFKKEIGNSVKEYVQKNKIERAKSFCPVQKRRFRESVMNLHLVREAISIPVSRK